MRQSATVTVDGSVEVLTGVIDKIYATDEVEPRRHSGAKVTINVINPAPFPTPPAAPPWWARRRAPPPRPYLCRQKRSGGQNFRRD